MSDSAASQPGHEQAEALARAHESAARSDAVGMLRALDESCLLDGIVRYLSNRWQSVHVDDLEFIVGEAVDAFYSTVKSGTRVRHVAAWLSKAAFRMTYNFHAARKEVPNADLSNYEDYRSDSTIIADHDARRKNALQFARRMLPTLGEDNVQRVIEYLLDAVEAGREDLPAQEIADAMGVTSNTVRTWMSRGLRRLTRRARDEGLTRADFDVPEAKGELLGGDGGED